MACYVGARVSAVTIDPDWDEGPARHADIQVEWPAGTLSDRDLRQRLAQVALAGPVAEMIYVGDPFHPGLVPEWAADWRVAWRAIETLVPDQRRRLAYLEALTVQLHQLLRQDQPWAAIAAIVDHLVAHERLEGEEVEAILAQWMS